MTAATSVAHAVPDFYRYRPRAGHPDWPRLHAEAYDVRVWFPKLTTIPLWMLLYWGMILRATATFCRWFRLTPPARPQNALHLGRAVIDSAVFKMLTLGLFVVTTRQSIYRFALDPVLSWLPFAVALLLYGLLFRPRGYERRLAFLALAAGPAIEILYINVGRLHHYHLGWVAGIPLWIALWWVLAIWIWSDLSLRLLLLIARNASRPGNCRGATVSGGGPEVMRPSAATLLIGAGVSFLIGCSGFRPDSGIYVATALISHNLCSEVFVSGLAPNRVYSESLKPRPGMSLVNWAVRYDVDWERMEVRTTVADAFPSRAVYRDGLGCIVVHGEEPTDSPARADTQADGQASMPLLPQIAGPAVVEPVDERLRAAVDRAFREPDGTPARRTTAVIVVHDGQVIAERYAPGYDVDTPLLGYSATKSVMSALVGILVRRERLAVAQPAPVPAWTDAEDPRRQVTIDHLLRMTSGLALDETGSPFSPVARMLYLERDMAGFAESADLAAPPGSTWNYTSGNTLILSRIIRDAVGGHTADVLRFAHRELFDPLGMRHVTLEFDATGTPVGSTYMLAPARDWARFAMLYLNDGVVGGRQILPEGWVHYSSTPTLDTGYGAGFWTNRVAGHLPWSPVLWSIPGAPPDSFYARGLLGQYIVVVPSERLVVARFGMTHETSADIEGVGLLIADVIGALGGAVPHR